MDLKNKTQFSIDLLSSDQCLFDILEVFLLICKSKKKMFIRFFKKKLRTKVSNDTLIRKFVMEEWLAVPSS